MDFEGEYLLAESIVQSGQTDEEWNLLRQGKDNWPSSKVTWKQFRAYSLDELQEEIKLYKQTITGKIFPFIIIFLIIICPFHFIYISNQCCLCVFL
jgi:hypothetical protein